MLRNGRVIRMYCGLLVPLRNAKLRNLESLSSIIFSRKFGGTQIQFYSRYTPPISKSGATPNLHIWENTAWCDKNIVRGPYGGDKSKPPPEKDTPNYLLYALALALLGAGVYLLSAINKKPSTLLPDEYEEINVTKDPEKPEDIPNNVPYLLIGGGTASLSAAKRILELDSGAKILIISNDDYIPYMRQALITKLWRKNYIDPEENDSGLPYYEPNTFYTDCKSLLVSGGVALAKGWNVESIDLSNNAVVLEDNHRITFEKCLIATGALPKNLDIFQNAPANIKSKIILYSGLRQYEQLDHQIRDGNVKDIAIIGGGLIGSQLAFVLNEVGMKYDFKVHHIIRGKHLMEDMIPGYLSEWVIKKMREEGIDVLTDSEVRCVDDKDQRLLLKLSKGRTVQIDNIVVAIGREPNTELARKSGLEVSTGCLANAELLARTNIWVAGDCVTFYDNNTGERVQGNHQIHAWNSGYTAGENMVGDQKPYKYCPEFSLNLGSKYCYDVVGRVGPKYRTVAAFIQEANTQLGPPNDDSGDKPNEERKNEEKKNGSEREYKRGIVYYLDDETVVGIVLWNVPNRRQLAIDILNKNIKYADIDLETGDLLAPTC